MNYNSEAINAFVLLVRLAIGHTSKELPSKINWNTIQEIAEEQGLTAIVLDGIEKAKTNKANLGINQEVLLEWIGEVMQNYEVRYQQYKTAIAELAGFYNSYGYKMMILKGYACSLNWPKPEHRPCGDIDIWQFGQQKEADELLEKSNTNRTDSTNNFRIDRSHHHHTMFYWGDFMVENHYDFINVHSHLSSKVLEKVFKELGSEDNLNDNDDHNNVGKRIQHVVVNGEKVFLPSPNLHALFLLRHAASHFAAEGISLRNVLDWAFFMEKHSSKVDWKCLMPIIDDYHMRDFFNCINAICVDDLGFSASIFPSVQFLPELKEKVLKDIVNPEFQHEPPKQMSARLSFKYRRWKSNKWKRKLCYDESSLSNLLCGVWAHLLKPKTI